jgi:hypothetical protein
VELQALAFHDEYLTRRWFPGKNIDVAIIAIQGTTKKLRQPDLGFHLPTKFSHPVSCGQVELSALHVIRMPDPSDHLKRACLKRGNSALVKRAGHDEERVPN